MLYIFIHFDELVDEDGRKLPENQYNGNTNEQREHNGYTPSHTHQKKNKFNTHTSLTNNNNNKTTYH